jgi:homopolymeric O-antigen transport system permease protein
VTEESGGEESLMVISLEKIKKTYKLLPPLLVRDIKEKYAGSLFGVFWTVLQPTLYILLYWVVFSQIIKIKVQTDTGDVPFFAFLLSGILPWFAFQEGITRGASSIIEKRHVIKKVMFPVYLFPLSSVMSAFVHYGIGILIFLSAYFFWQGDVSVLQVVSVFCLMILQIVLSSGLSLMFAALSVYIRDIVQFLGVAFQVLFYLSTVLYPLTSVPAKLKFVVLLNPFTALSEAYHSVVLHGRLPETWSMIYLLAATVLSAATGVWVFKKLKPGFTDIL